MQLGLAVVAIIVFNVYQFCDIDGSLYPHGAVHTVLSCLDAAVPWIFVITAFAIFEPIARASLNPARIGARPDPVLRQIARLLPAYYVAIIVVWLPRQHRLPGDWRDLIEHSTFTQVFDHKRIFYTNGPAWAVSVLIIFYLILVGLVASAQVFPRVRSTRARVVWLYGLTAALASVSLMWKAWSLFARHRPTLGSSTTWYGPASNFDEFAIGMALAITIATGHGRSVSRSQRTALRLAGMAILISTFVERSRHEWVAAYFSTLCALGFAFIVAAAVPLPRTSARPRSLRGLAALGVISYSTYLWHEPVQLALAGPLGVIAKRPSRFIPDTILVLTFSVLAGATGYVLLERPTNQLLDTLKHHRGTTTTTRASLEDPELSGV